MSRTQEFARVTTSVAIALAVIGNVSRVAGDSLSIAARPTATIAAEVRSDGRPPAEVRLRLTPAGASSDGEQALFVVCPVGTDRNLLCSVPAGTYDVRLSAAGYAPHHEWNLALPRAKTTTLPRVSLVRGAAVIGRVVHEENGSSARIADDVRITLTPAAASPAGHTPRPALRVKPDANGRFTFSAVLPGEYLVAAATKRLASDSRSIRVLPDLTAELNEPLTIGPPRKIRVLVTPPLDPQGDRWHVALSRLRGRRLEPIVSACAGADGQWEHAARAGEYSLAVTRSDGSAWGSVPVRVNGADENVAVVVPAVRVEGKVRFGNQPLAARLIFGGEHGPIRQSVVSAEDGTFEAVLPRGADHRWDVFIEAETPPVRTTLRDVHGRQKDDTVVFEIALPSSAFTGTVLDADGTPEQHALVTLTSSRGDFDQIDTAADGTFQFSGIAPGEYRIMAESELKSSEAVPVAVSESDSPPVTLVLKPVQQLSGRVVTQGRLPIVGASVNLIRRNDAPLAASAASNEAGAFALMLPPETTLFDILVAPPGFAAIMARLPSRTDKELVVDVEPYGGSVIIEVPRAQHAMLKHAGAAMAVAYVTEIVGGRATDEGSRRRITLPMMERGEYAVCDATRCQSGYLAANGTLALSLD